MLMGFARRETMRLVLSLTLLALLTPFAAARPDIPDLTEPIEAGPCVARLGWYWPGESLGARCEDADGGTLVAFSHGTCALGHYTYVQVGNGYAYLPCDAWLA